MGNTGRFPPEHPLAWMEQDLPLYKSTPSTQGVADLNGIKKSGYGPWVLMPGCL